MYLAGLASVILFADFDGNNRFTFIEAIDLSLGKVIRREEHSLRQTIIHFGFQLQLNAVAGNLDQVTINNLKSLGVFTAELYIGFGKHSHRAFCFGRDRTAVIQSATCH